MRCSALWLIPVLLCGTASCADRDGPAAPPPGAADLIVADSGFPPGDRGRLERLARRTALALRDPVFRAQVRASLLASPFPEHKLQFQRFLRAPLGAAGTRPMAALAVAGGEIQDAVAADAGQAMPLEFYFPVPAQRDAWAGDENVLVATAIGDHDAPVAYDTRGRRHLLSPDHPPATPVLALEPQETDLDTPPQRTICSGEQCDGGSSSGGSSGSGTGGGGPGPMAISATPGLHMTYVQFNETFEGWLKGNPEFEIHVLGPTVAGSNTQYNTLWCVGEHGNTYWDLNGTSWQGDVVLYTQSQLDAFHAKYPGQNFSLLALEDDDTSCQVKVDNDHMSDFVSAVNAFSSAFKGAKDNIGANGKTVDAVRALWALITSAINWIKTNDDLIGVAVANTVTGYSNPAANWSFIGYGQGRYGWINLEMR
jgi:hypothetical protein